MQVVQKVAKIDALYIPPIALEIIANILTRSHRNGVSLLRVTTSYVDISTEGLTSGR
jgi:hypothetical protein